MRKYLTTLSVLAFLFVPSITLAATKASATWKPVTPPDYTPITWAKARGVASFEKPPSSNGSIDFLTRIYLPYNHVQLIASSSPRISWGPGNAPFASDTVQDWAVARMPTEVAKTANPAIQFLWNVPFFNMTMTTTDLSLALKSSDSLGYYITSGSRPPGDMASDRRMLIIDNKTGTAQITDFDADVFASSTYGDQAVEGFSPKVAKSEGDANEIPRLFLGVTSDHKELVVYCSQQASPQEASDALTAAGVDPENQLQADGGGSATCGYNLPGQYFVEPNRTLPYLMGAMNLTARGTVTTQNLNVRSGPGTKYGAVGKLTKGTTVEVYEEKNNFLRISQDNEWVSADYVKNSNTLAALALICTRLSSRKLRSGPGLSSASLG